MTRVLETERLALRHFAASDAAFALELVNEPDFLRFIGDKGVRDLAGARAYLEQGPIRSYAEHGHGLYLVELKATGEPLGMCGLLRRETLEDADIGFAFLARHRNRGYGFEAAAGVLEHARRALGIERVVAVAAPDNAASAALLAKLGLYPAGSVRLTPDGDANLLFAATAGRSGGPAATRARGLPRAPG